MRADFLQANEASRKLSNIDPSHQSRITMALKLGQDNSQTGKHGLVSLETLYAKILILS